MPHTTPPRPRRIGFISTRFAGTDGVSLETGKWAEVLERLGHTCYYFAGYTDRPPERSHVVPEAYFRHDAVDAIYAAAFLERWSHKELADRVNPAIADIYTAAFSSQVRPPAVSRDIHELRRHLKRELYAFADQFDLELLVVENALAIPMNIPLGLAISEFIAETGYPAIAHHHDFYWERARFLVNSVWDYLTAAFPPVLPSIRHVVINSVAARELSLRTGLAPLVVANVMDFDRPPQPPDDYARDLRGDLGLAPGERLFLQPTRVVERKGIEHAIELTRRLGLDARLVISHASGDEGDSYEHRLREFAALLGVPVVFVSELIDDARGRTPDGRKIYAVWDAYGQADLITYPSTLEGFGNAFLEAVYFGKPIVVNNYSIYEVDIKPKGFQVIEFGGFISEATLAETRALLADPERAAAMAEHNYQLARRYFSYQVLERRLQTLIADCFGEEAR
jgi:glycosyltransferase involved in cell wall biosynthesis